MARQVIIKQNVGGIDVFVVDSCDLSEEEMVCNRCGEKGAISGTDCGKEVF